MARYRGASTLGTRGLSNPLSLSRAKDSKMSSLRAKISQVTTKKVPVLALVVVAMFGMVAGVLAANLAVTPTSNTGEIGTYHTSSGTMTVRSEEHTSELQ